MSAREITFDYVWDRCAEFTDVQSFTTWVYDDTETEHM